MNIYIRCGDQDDYHEFQNLNNAAQYLKKMKVKALKPYNQMGVIAKNYQGNNYISIYLGNDINNPQRGPTTEELQQLNRIINGKSYS